MANINIGGRLHSTATGNTVVGANEILDDSINKKQSEINAETYRLVENVNKSLENLSPEQTEALSVAEKANNNEIKLGYFECETESNIAAKVITNAASYILSKGGSIKIKMINDNIASNVTLNINSTGAKTLYYNNELVSPTNTWKNNEIIEVYYDGNNYYANNIECIEKFATGEKIKEVGIDDEPTAKSENLIKSGGVYTSLKGLESETNTKITKVTSNLIVFQNVIQNINGDALYVTDADGNVIAKINNQGIESVEVAITSGKKLSEVPNDILEEFYKKQLYVSDNNGNVVLNIDEKGNLHYVGDDILVHNDWWNKIISTYGDSVTAVNNGDFTYPYSFDSIVDSWNWGNRVAQYYKMSKHYGRGIGGQGYKWTTANGNGGTVTFVNAISGVYFNRNNEYNYDNYNGDIPKGCVKVRGCLASWSRITAMYPESIKDSIDIVLVMAHNDAYDSTECSFIQDDTTDPEWAASGENYYGKINGDYDLTTLRGGIASTIMKLQLWMPNAIIVLMSGISGHGTTGKLNVNINNNGLINIAQAVREMSNLTSIPCIDTFATDGINGWNRTSYIADTIHPYTSNGSKMFARSVIGGLKSILPYIE